MVHAPIRRELDAAIRRVIDQSAFVGGSFLESFEKAFATYLGIPWCVGVANGTDALEIALWALALPKGSEVIVPVNTFIATAEAITTAGLKVVFADCDFDYTLSVADLEKRITARTSAVIPVHLYGQPARMDEILDVAFRYELKVIEDCSQSHGALYKGKSVGTFGDLATFSFYPSKNLGALGDGGAVVGRHEALAEKIRMVANHGRDSQFNHKIEGRNSRLDGLQAAILEVKLRHLDGWVKHRRALADRYFAKLDPARLALPTIRPEVRHAWHLFVVRHPDRDGFRVRLRKMGVETGMHYPFALPHLPPYQRHSSSCADFWGCQVDRELVSLPMGEHLTPADAEMIARLANEAATKACF